MDAAEIAAAARAVADAAYSAYGLSQDRIDSAIQYALADAFNNFAAEIEQRS